MQHVFIINPKAGKYDQSQILSNEIDEVFNKFGTKTNNDKYIIEITKCIGDATDIAKKYGEKGEKAVLYACGGDGTINEVVNGMYKYNNLSLATVPIGTGNDFIRAFGDNLKKNFRSIKELVFGEETSIDLLMVSGKACLNIASAGFDSDVARNMVKFKKIPFISGEIAYMFSLIYCFFKCIKTRFSMEIDGMIKNESDYTFVVCANGKSYGGGFKAAPYSDLTDGLIDFFVVPKVSRFKFLTLINIYKKGEHFEKTDFIKLIRCKKVKIKAHDDLYMNIDGEITPIKDPEISILPNAVKLIVPSSIHFKKNKSEIKQPQFAI